MAATLAGAALAAEGPLPSSVRAAIGPHSSGGDNCQRPAIVAGALPDKVDIDAEVDAVGPGAGLQAVAECGSKGRMIMLFRQPCATEPRPLEVEDMRPNPLLDIWKRGDAAVNGWLAVPSAFSAEVMAHQGWDSLTIDLQHGLVDYQVMVGMLQAISTTSTVPVVRVPWLEPGILMKALDAGAYGVICPMVNTVDDAARLVAWTNYAPKGTRSFGPVRALLYGGDDYPQKANQTIVRFAMIETAQALDNLDAILSVEGIDAIYVGPSDLSLSLGCRPAFDDVDPKAAQAIDHIVERARAHRIVAGIHNGAPEVALARVARGFQFVTVGSDARLMAAGARQAIAKMRAAPKSATGSGPS